MSKHSLRVYFVAGTVLGAEHQEDEIRLSLAPEECTVSERRKEHEYKISGSCHRIGLRRTSWRRLYSQLGSTEQVGGPGGCIHTGPVARNSSTELPGLGIGPPSLSQRQRQFCF